MKLKDIIKGKLKINDSDLTLCYKSIKLDCYDSNGVLTESEYKISDLIKGTCVELDVDNMDIEIDVESFANYILKRIHVICRKKVESVSMALCESHHAIPQATDGTIFGSELDPLATTELETEAYNKLKGLEVKNLNLYVTGLTVALVSVINACRKLNIKLTLWHYDRDKGKYYPQSVC